MDRGDYQTDEPLYLDTEDNCDENKTTTSISFPLQASWNDLNGLTATWTPEMIFRLSAISVLMLLTLLGNAVVIITIISCAELRKKRVNVFILNLAVGDLCQCFVSMPSYKLFMAFSQWRLGAVVCKLAGYGIVVGVAITILLLTAMSIDRYQVRVHDEFS